MFPEIADGGVEGNEQRSKPAGPQNFPCARLCSMLRDLARAKIAARGGKAIAAIFDAYPQNFNVPGYRAPVYLRDCVADHAVFRQCFVMQQYDVRGFPQHRRLRDAYEQMISEGRTPLIIDGGSNIGLAARWFAAQFPEARIAVVEPDDANFALVVRNTEQLGERIIRLKGGVWDRPARLVITNPQAGATAFTVEERELGEEEGIRAYTIPEICDIAGVADPFIVKLDIEGAQASVFRSNTEWVPVNLITLELDD